MSNKLYFGDNLHILRRYIKDESVDLIYLDPPFNSDSNYNVLFKSPAIRGHRAQIQAFDDTWKWGEETERTYDELLERGGAAAIMVDALKFSLGRSDVMAYLVMMTIWLIELHRVLKQTGSLYLHCDSTASHYLKIIIDAIFGPSAFRAEIVWERTYSHNMKSKHWHKSSDTILFYTKSDCFTFNDQFEPYEEEQLSRFKQDETGRLYKAENLTFSTVRRHRQFEWRGAKPPPHRSWGADFEKLEKWYAEGRILLKADGTPRMDGLKVYLDDLPGKKIGNVWTDIPRIANTSEERIGYPTQKPVALMERIIAASSNPGDVVLDPFCGCGTTVHAAQRLGRKWAGIDITHVAIHVISDRLARWLPQAKFDIIGQPKDLAGAQALADHDKYQFQWWATWLCGGQPFGGEKKGKDRGVDGTLEFVSRRGVHDWGVISVKGGKTVNPSMVRDLAGTVAREKAALGVFLCIAEPSREMELEAVSAGFVTLGGVEYRKIQIRTIEQLLQGKGVDCPMRLTTAQKAPEVAKPKPEKVRAAKRPQKAADGQIPLMLPISGGRKDDAQKPLPLGEPLLTAEQPGAAKRRKRG